MDFDTKEGLLRNTLIHFFTVPKNRDVLVPILTDSVPISLRVLDYFITNYSRDHTKAIVKDPLLRNFNVYSSYKSQLKAFNKKLFDPFCRLHHQSNIHKFNFYYEKEKFVTTTTGQLNFFKWAIENKIIDYVTCHYEEIKADLKAREVSKRNRSSTSSSFECSSTTTTDSETSSWKPLKRTYVISFE